MRHLCKVVLVTVGVLACEEDSAPNPVQQAFAAADHSMEAEAAVAFRFPRDGGLVRLYRLPTLEEVTWRFELGGRRTAETVGLVSDDDLIYALAERDEDTSYDLIALDLVAGRARTIDTVVSTATIGPTGTAYLIHPNGSFGHVEHRTLEAWSDTLHSSVIEAWGAARGRLLTLLESGDSRELVLLSRGQSPVRHTVPEGNLAVSTWARMVAVVVDSGVILVDPAEPASRSFVRVNSPPSMAVFSNSGHQIYVAAGGRSILVIDRFQRRISDSLSLPTSIDHMRVGPLGRRLLAHSLEDESISIVDLVQLGIETTISGSWDADLPAIAPDGTILLRRGRSLVALEGTGLNESTIEGVGSNDLWLVAQWDPRRPALELARDSTRSDQETASTILVQISSSRNAAWAQALADELRRAGMPATVLPADSTDDLYRVVMGPYDSREEAETSARRLGRPFFIREIDRPIP